MQNSHHRGLFIFLVLAANSFFVYFHRSAVAVITQDLIGEFSISAVQIGFLGSMWFYAYAGMQLPGGVVADAIGPRKTITLFIGITALGSILFGMAPNLLWASIARLLIGIGSSVVFVCAMKIFTTWFRSDQISTYVGLFMLAGNIGAIVATAPLAILTIKIGWRSTFGILAGVSLLLTILSWGILRDAPKTATLKKNAPELDPRKEPRLSFNEVRGLLINRQLLSVAAVLAVSFGTLLAFSGLWAVPYLMHTYQLTKAEAGYLVSVIPIGISIGAPLFGVLSDKIRRRKPVYLIGTLGFVFAWIPLAFRTANLSKGVLIGIFFVLGICYGLAPIAAAMCAEIVKKEQYRSSVIGIAIGYMNMWPFLTVSLYQLLIGYILDTMNPVQEVEGIFSVSAYSWAFQFCLVSLIIVSLLFFVIKETYPSSEEHQS